MNQPLKTLTIILLALPQLTHAQGRKVELGIEGGPNVVFFRAKNEVIEYNPVVYSSASFVFQYDLSKLISLRTGLGYEAKGYQTPLQINANGTDLGTSIIRSKFNYLILPLLARMNFGQKVKFFINAGPYLGYMMSKKDRISAYEEYSGNAMNHSIKEYRRLDFGISAGLGIGIPITENWVISLEARNNLGLIPLKKDNINGTIFNNSSNLLVGISYRLKPRIEAPEDRFAKNSQENRFMLGLETGPNITALWIQLGSSNYSYTNRSGYGSSYGIAFQWNSRKCFSLKTGIAYEQRSFEQNSASGSVTISTSSLTNVTAKHDYLSVPLLAKFTFGKKVQFFCNAGINVSYLTRVEDYIERYYYYSIGMNSYSGIYENQSNDMIGYKRFNFGVCAGAGIGIPLKKYWYISAELRDNFGPLSIYRTSYYKAATNTYSLLLGVSYKLGFRDK